MRTLGSMRSAKRQLLAVARYRLNCYDSRVFFPLPSPQPGTLPDFIRDGIWPSVQTVSDVCLKRICWLHINAFGVLEVLDDSRAICILFAVFSDGRYYDCVQVNIYTVPHKVNYIRLAAKVAPLAQKWLEKETGIPYGLPKMGKQPRCDISNK